MDSCLPDWNAEVGVEFPLPTQRKPLGLESDLVELVWQNGEVVLNSQTNRKRTDQAHKHGQSTTLPNNSIQDFETISWTDCPIDESFDKEFYENLLSEIPSSCSPLDPNKPLGKFDTEKIVKFDSLDANHVSLPLASPVFDQELESVAKNDYFQSPAKKQASSHCASNQVVKDVDMSWGSSCGIGSKTMSFGVKEKYCRNVSPRYESTDKEHKETVGQAIASCSGGSGSSFWNQSNETDSRKRKSRDVEESECRSDATELESAPGNKPSQKSGTSRRSRVAEVHNLSERRRRDRINERLRALQELIPHSNKSDKASMLDEAIEYMKSLQLQLQLMWMGSGMAPMMVPGMQHYMSRFGVGIGPPMLPAIQNLMRLSRLPLVDQTVNMAPRMNQAPVNYQNQMQSSGYLEPYANYMGFHTMPNTSQAMNMFNIGFHSARQNQSLTPPGNGNGSIG